MNVVMHIKTSDKKTPTIGSTQLSLTNPPSAAKTTALDPPSRLAFEYILMKAKKLRPEKAIWAKIHLPGSSLIAFTRRYCEAPSMKGMEASIRSGTHRNAITPMTYSFQVMITSRKVTEAKIHPVILILLLWREIKDNR